MTYRPAAFLLGLCLAAAPAIGAAVNVSSQTRSVHVSIPSITADPGIDETVTAPDNNTFDESLDRTLEQLDQTNTALASQLSSFGELGNVFTATAQGTTSYSATGLEGIVFAESNFSITFTLAEDRDYSISGTGSFPDTGSGASNFSVILTGPGGTVESFTKADFDPALNDGAQINPTFGNTGTVPAGEYTLAALSGVSGGTNTTEILANFSVEFTATAADDGGGGGGGGGGQIPLPAAVWPGMMMLGGAGAAVIRKRVQV